MPAHYLMIRIDNDEPLQPFAPKHRLAAAIVCAPDIEGADRAWGQPCRVERYSRCRLLLLMVARFGQKKAPDALIQSGYQRSLV